MLKKHKKGLTSSLLHAILKSSRRYKTMTYTFLNLLTSEVFTVSAPTFQDALMQAFKVCPFSKVLTEL